MRLFRMRWALVGMVVCFGTAAPVTWSPARGFMAVEAVCADGTCCPEPTSECIINNIVIQDAYRKTGAGSCKDPAQPAPTP